MKNKILMQLKITLQHVEPITWVRLLVPIDYTFGKLHKLIQQVFGWQNSHLHEFRPTQRRNIYYGDAEQIAEDPFLDDMNDESLVLTYDELKRGNVVYTYDFGDEWEHLIHLEDVISTNTLDNQQLPFCVKARGGGRMEDMGGFEDDIEPFDVEEINFALEDFDKYVG